ncbi:MAG: glycosyltransferase family 4 protein [Catenulispora sp.]|nr:glycosyltransferase family 4 protein [Catenulispora sp.]
MSASRGYALIGGGDGDRAGAGWPPLPERVVPLSELPPQPQVPRIKVLHVITRFWAGAGGNTMLSAIGMDQDEYEVWLAGVPGGDLWERTAAAGVHCVQIEGFKEVLHPNDLLVFLKLRRLMKQERFHIVHTHSAKGGFLGRLAAWSTRTPVIIHTFHGFSFHDRMPSLKRGIYLLLERSVRPMTDTFLAVAPRIAAEAVQTRLARPGSVRVAPSAVALDTVPATGDRSRLAEFGISPDQPVVGTCGRIDAQKAPLDFVRTAALVAKQRPDTAFLMIGDGELADSVRTLADQLGVKITITGYVQHAAELSAALDVFVITSLYEGLGRALTEAAAAGRPLVATAVNGIPDLVAPGVTGLLAEPEHPAGIAASVLWMLDHPEQAKAMGRNARERVLGWFAPETMVAVIDRTYRRELGLPARRTRR